MTQVPRNRLCVSQSLLDEDHITQLPDGVIGHILSLLPITDAVKTSVLSRDWVRKWTFMTNIEINDDNYRETPPLYVRIAHFINFMYMVLIRTGNSTLSRVSLRCHMEFHPMYLETWISMALRLNVESLTILPFRVPRIESHWCFSGWTSLTELDICLSCTLEVPTDNYCFTKLRKLHLITRLVRGNIKLKTVQPTSDRIILTFPILEDLIFIHCEWLDVSCVEIHAPELMNFETICVNEERNYEIKIFAAKLATLEVMGCFLDSFDLHTPSVSRATLVLLPARVGQEYHKTLLPRAHKILKKVTGVKYSKLSGDILKYFKALTPSATLGRLSFPTFGLLKELHIDYHCLIEDTIYVLQVLPPLEMLTLDVMFWEDDSERGEPWPHKIVSTLKKIKLLGMHGTSLQYDFSKFVLENATNLEEMAVCPEATEEVIDILSNLIPKSSSCRMVLEDWE